MQPANESSTPQVVSKSPTGPKQNGLLGHMAMRGVEPTLRNYLAYAALKLPLTQEEINGLPEQLRAEAAQLSGLDEDL
jgi:hypothetical protein